MKYDLRWKYEYDTNGYWNGNSHGWNIARIPAPDHNYVKIDPTTLGMVEDEYGNRRYKNDGNGSPLLNEQEPTQKQKDKKKEEEYKQKLSTQIVDLIDECSSWEELKTKTEELKQSVIAVMKKEKQYV
jgi:hypothetical protein